MLIDIITLFPKQISDFLNYSIIKRAMDEKHVEIKFHDLRKWAVDKRGSVDDKPYGGGKGMILRCEPVVSAIKELRIGKREKVKDKRENEDIRGYPLEIRMNPGDQSIKQENLKEKQQGYHELVAIFDARGETFNQKMAFEFSKLDHLILICGHYEGFDERILKYVDLSLSIGEYVLTGGEIPALAVVDAVTRLLPGVLKEGVVENESFSGDQGNKGDRGKKEEVEYPQYTRPEDFEGHKVPEVLLSGNHEEVEKWRDNN
jgi:tRNA (guanine37-N1)-methyltransferase